MSARFHTYLSDTGNRGKVMAVLNFLPMALEGPVRNAGCEALAESLGNLSKMADMYRGVTRLSLGFNAFAPTTLKALAKPKDDVFTWRLEQLSHAFHMVFCIHEKAFVLARRGVLGIEYMRLGGIAVTCWFYTMIIGIIRQLYLLMKHSPCCQSKTVASEEEKKPVPFTHEQCKRSLVSIVKMTSYCIFAMTCIPEGGPKMLLDVRGPLVPFHILFTKIAPPKIYMSHSARGLVGLIAALCDFY